MDDKPLLDTYYLTFTKDHDSDDAERRFFEKFGAYPDKYIDFEGKLWVGPAPERNGNYDA